MESKSIRKTTYDRNNDILYVTFSNASGASYADAGPFGIEIMRDMDTEEITGLMVYYPKKEMRDRQEKLQSLGFCFPLADMLH